MDIDDLLNYINDDDSKDKGKKGKKDKGKKGGDKKHAAEVKSETAPSDKDKVTSEDKPQPKDKEEAKEDKKEEVSQIEEVHKDHSQKDNPEITAEEKKKKKKKNKKKKKEGSAKEIESKIEEGIKENPYRKLLNWEGKTITNSRFQDNSMFRILKNWEEKEWSQTNYPTKSIDEQFLSLSSFPVGMLVNYESTNLWRSTSQEKIELEKLRLYDVQSLRKAAECHRQIRKYAQTIIRPGVKLIEMCIKLETMLKFIINSSCLDCGQAFPTGCSLNHTAAHYTPNPGDETVLKYDDVCKIDFGTHVNGLIIDCAFTVAFNPDYDNLLKASQEATREGVRLAGIDARLGEIGAGIQEVMESFEVTIGGKLQKIKAVKNLCGHTMDLYKVHAGKSVPIVKKEDNTKMEENELYAIETFASTGKGYVNEDKDCSHYMKDPYATGDTKIRGDKPRALFHFIDKHFSTLAWCRRWLDEGGFLNHSLALRQLIDANIVNPYPPLADIEGCYVSQFEHTLLLKPTCKEVFSFGDDY